MQVRSRWAAEPRGPRTDGRRLVPRAARWIPSADGTRLHVEEHGPEGAPTAVLAHGWCCSTLFWEPVAEQLLARGLRVVVYDQRGHGRSDTPRREGFSTDALADDLEAVVRRHVPEGERAVLVGHSMGTMTIMAAAGREAVRERTAAVLLCSTGAADLVGDVQVVPLRSPRLRYRVHRALLTSPLPLGPSTRASRWLLRYGTMTPAATPEQVEFCSRIVHACAGRSRAAWGRVLHRLDLRAELALLDAPTIVLYGAEDRLIPPALSRAVAEALPELVDVVELSGSGHMTPVERPEEVAGAVLRLVDGYLPASAAAAGRGTV
ncbi:alpha/beta hydrolase [Streptomyces capparidis]